jgi:hypothetical protein
VLKKIFYPSVQRPEYRIMRQLCKTRQKVGVKWERKGEKEKAKTE